MGTGSLSEFDQAIGHEGTEAEYAEDQRRRSGERKPIASDWDQNPKPGVEPGTKRVAKRRGPDPELKALADWLQEQTWSEFALSLAAYYRRKGTLTEKQRASAEKMRAKVQAKDAERQERKAQGPRAEPPEGIHFHEGTVYKVQKNQARTSQYAKRLDPESQGFVYIGKQAPYWSLSADTLMTLEQAQEYGHLYGMCCKCGATLTDEKSIEAGIGPVCAQGF